MKQNLLPICGSLLVLSLTTVSCANSQDTTPEKIITEATSMTQADSFPVSIDDCGRTITVNKRPERVLALNQTSLEYLLTMGFADQLAGVAAFNAPIPDDLVQENAKVKRLDDWYINLETALAQNPDLVIGSLTYTFTEAGSGSFNDYAKVGVPAYLQHSACVNTAESAAEDGTRTQKITVNDIYQDVLDISTLMGDKTKGEQLVAQLKQRVEGVQNNQGLTGKTVAFWYASTESPYMAGGTGAPQIIADANDMTNIFADRLDEWPEISWEAVAAANPDYLIIGDLTRNKKSGDSAEDKLEFLHSNPITKHLRAVENNQIIVIPGAALDPSLRTITAIEQVANSGRG